MEPIEFLLYEGTLNDNVLRLAPQGFLFKGGYIAEVVEYRFKNAWCNSRHIKKFRREISLMRFLEKHYPEAIDMICFSDTCLDTQTTIINYEKV